MNYAKRFFLFLAFLIGCSTVIFAQQKPYNAPTDSILLLNGKHVVAHVVDTLNGIITVKNPNGKKDNIIVDRERVYSIKFADGTNKIYYQEDTLNGYYFTVEEMDYFIKGEQDARHGFKPWWTAAGGGAAGFGGGLIASIVSPLPLFGFFIFANLPKVKIPHETVSNQEYLKHDTYVMGYERVARSKRAFNALLSGLSGLAAGIVIGIIYLK